MPLYSYYMLLCFIIVLLMIWALNAKFKVSVTLMSEENYQNPVLLCSLVCVFEVLSIECLGYKLLCIKRVCNHQI